MPDPVGDARELPRVLVSTWRLALPLACLKPAGNRPAGSPFLASIVAAGGRHWPEASGEQPKPLFAQALDEMRARYLLTFYEQGEWRAGWHALKVSLKRGRADIIARPGHVVPPSISHGVTVSVAVFVPPLNEPEMVTVCVVSVAVVATVNTPTDEPAATVILAGTVATAMLDDSVTRAPPEGAAWFSVAVP